jgi:hypothetical protein
MIAGHDDLWTGKRIQKAPGFFKLCPFGALREITGDDNQIWFGGPNAPDQCLDGCMPQASEVRIGEMSYGAHRSLYEN